MRLLFAGHQRAQAPSGLPTPGKTDLRILVTPYEQKCISKEASVQIWYQQSNRLEFIQIDFKDRKIPSGNHRFLVVHDTSEHM